MYTYFLIPKLLSKIFFIVLCTVIVLTFNAYKEEFEQVDSGVIFARVLITLLIMQLFKFPLYFSFAFIHTMTIRALNNPNDIITFIFVILFKALPYVNFYVCYKLSMRIKKR